jgi:hypothetical protein
MVDGKTRQGVVPLRPSIPSITEVHHRDQLPTFTDPVELEAARVRSVPTSPPPAMQPAAAPTANGVVPAESSADPVATYEHFFRGFDRVPSIVVSPDDLAALNLEGRAIMLLGLLDGCATIQTLLDMGILSAMDTLAGLEELLKRGVIALK